MLNILFAAVGFLLIILLLAEEFRDFLKYLATAHGQARDEISGLSLGRGLFPGCGCLYRLFSLDFIFDQVFL
jgi:hypothetical protein